MAIPSAALAYRRSALMTATKVTTKPPSPEVLEHEMTSKTSVYLWVKLLLIICVSGTQSYVLV